MALRLCFQTCGSPSTRPGLIFVMLALLREVISLSLAFCGPGGDMVTTVTCGANRCSKAFDLTLATHTHKHIPLCDLVCSKIYWLSRVAPL